MAGEFANSCPACSTISQHRQSIEADFFNLSGHYQQQRTLSEGQFVFREGQTSDTVYCVHTGQIKLSRSAPGVQQVLRLVTPGYLFGHRAAVVGEAYQLTAQASEPTTVCATGAELFRHLLRMDSAFAARVLEQLAGTLSEAEDRIVSLAHDSVRRRCAKMLLYLRRGPEVSAISANEVRPGLRRIEMAQMIGTTPETLSRTLHTLARQDLIEISRTDIRILNPEALEQIAGSPEEATVS